MKKVIVRVHRCDDQGFNCKDFQTWRFDNFCSILNWKNQMWNGVVDSMRPPFRCPIKKTVYEGRNISYDFNAVMNWYPEYAKYHWRHETEVLNERNELVFCLSIESHVYQYRKRNRKS
ncbi:uncharacterized protein LOC135845251 [Planococcus citri]|uniref:uncharacterized protein LOC135845251 n=1 Tax=Planococcus citri TaxID=170843 RepID=UPI0031F73F9B